MSRQRFMLLAVAAVLAIAGALYLSAQRNLRRDPQGAALLPSLAGELNTVNAFSVRRRSATPTVTLHLQGGRWTVAERGDYPADVGKLRKVLLALSDAKIVEEKTSNPANFSIIGVEDPSLPEASGAELRFVARDGAHAVIVGKPMGEGNFVRRGGENVSYSVEPGISFETEPRFWIESRLLDIAGAGIQRIEVKPPAGQAYTIRRVVAGNTSDTGSTAAGNAGSTPVGNTGSNAAGSGAGAAPAAKAANPTPAAAPEVYVLEGVPAGRKAAESASLAPSPTVLSALNADDVTPVAGVDLSRATVETLTFSDGNVITLRGVATGDKHWITVDTSKDAALNAKAAGRAFDVAGYRFDAIFRPLEQLLVPKPAPPAANKAAPPSGPKSSPVMLPTKKPVPAPTP